MRMWPLRCCLSALACTSAGAQAAESFPSRPIRLIAPSSAGGPVDVIARILAQGYGESLGQQMVVDNRAGAGGLIGSELVAKSTPDGYTLLFGFSGPLVIVPQLNATPPPYDPLADFAPVSLTASAPYVLVVSASSPAKSVQDLVALAKAQPDKLFYGSGGNGTGIHMAGALFNMTAGTSLVHVPFKGAAPAMTALLAGQVHMMFNSLPGAMGQMKAGKVRALAIAQPKRSSLLPELPTMREAGLPLDATGWYGVLAPRATPKPVVAKLHAEAVKTVQAAAMKARMADQGVESIGSTPDEFMATIKEEWVKWGKVIKAAGLKAS